MSTDDSTRPDESPSSEVAETASTPVVQGRREAVREKAQQVHVRQSRARLVRRTALITSAVAVVAVVGVVVAWAVGASASKPQLSPDADQQDGFLVSAIAGGAAITSPDDATPSATPDAAQPAPSPSQTSTTAPVDIHVYVDYLSPSAREWQLANSAQLKSWVADGAATLTYHPVSMLTAKSNGTKYSLRAASAAACVATYSPASLFAFTDDLLSRQPAVDSDGLSDKQLADVALANGSDDPKQLRECIETEAFASWVKAATERAVTGTGDGVALAGTSMITVNGQAYVGEMTDPAEFSQFVLTTASGKSAKNQTPTPSPTASPSVTP
ncbi:MAG: thioredoxin domain-containing protein [Microbacterium sp.]|uniref:thioredoxin domain-containing protein n=1 Tax=Microbacterium sp. TaxID=51671 RepID=UPI001AC0D6E5|nr:thioredoxin domain-containing protein [Microbacterium sp.]MBN9178836.1 thioredoxin domain-containing protein [Microbacterium sp.]